MLFRSDRKSTRLNSSHTLISYAVFCLKKKNANRVYGHTRQGCGSVRVVHRGCPRIDRAARSFFFFNYTATPEIYTLSLHDALPIFSGRWRPCWPRRGAHPRLNNLTPAAGERQDRQSTRLNSRPPLISYAVFCL